MRHWRLQNGIPAHKAEAKCKAGGYTGAGKSRYPRKAPLASATSKQPCRLMRSVRQGAYLKAISPQRCCRTPRTAAVCLGKEAANTHYNGSRAFALSTAAQPSILQHAHSATALC